MNPSPRRGAAREIVAWWLFRSSLFTMPWVGLGVAHQITGRDFGAGLQLSWLLLLLSILLQVSDLGNFLRNSWRSWLPISGPLGVALLISVVGLWLAPGGEPWPGALLRFVKQIVQVIVMIAFVVVPAFYLVRGRALGDLARPVVWGAGGQLFYSVLQGLHFYHNMGLVAGLERVFTSNPAILAGSGQLYLGNVLQQVPRLRGTACEPLYLGNFLLLALPLVYLTGWTGRRRHLIAGLLGLLLLLTWSRGAWLAGVGAGLWGLGIAGRCGLLPWRGGLPWRRLGSLALAAVVLLWGLSLWQPELALPWRRLLQSFSMADWSNLTRLYSMQAAWRAFLLSPVVGIGWGQFAFHFAAVVDPMGLQSMFSWPVVNNLPLEILCETGLLGGAGLVWLAGSLWRRCQRNGFDGGDSRAAQLVLLLTALVAIWVQLLTFSQYNLPHIWFALGLVVGHLARPKRTLPGEAA